LADTHASGTRAIGSALLTHGRSTGRTTGNDTDDVYVTHVDNGYYLFNRRYPDVGIAINISM